jgi:hypothetical protein
MLMSPRMVSVIRKSLVRAPQGPQVMRTAAKRRLGWAGRAYAEREGDLSEASIVKDRNGSPSGLPGNSLAERLAQFQHPAYGINGRKNSRAAGATPRMSQT